MEPMGVSTKTSEDQTHKEFRGSDADNVNSSADRGATSASP